MKSSVQSMLYVLVSFLFFESCSSVPPRPPNIIVFVADDAGWRDFGCYGNSSIRTPHVDALAASGLRATRAFLTTAQCSPSRISMLTGKYPHATGAEDLHMPLPDGETMLPTYLARQGYFNGHMKKTHYGPNGEKQFDWYDPELDRFSAFLDSASTQPFFLWVGFTDPHRPYEEGVIGQPHDPSTVIVPSWMADTKETRADLALYYDEIARMDSVIGSFIAELDRRNLRENTLVIFLSDNGAPFPREKGTVYDAGVGTPLIFSWPGHVSSGTTYEGLISLVDLAPTLLEISGAEPAEEMQGRSIAHILNDQSIPGREYVFSERNWHNCDEHIRSVRSAEFKLIRNAYVDQPFGTPADISTSPSWKALALLRDKGALSPVQADLFGVPRPEYELYDLHNDPLEFHNLSQDTSFRTVKGELMVELDRWIRETDDFSPTLRTRGDNTNRTTGVKFTQDIPPMKNAEIKP